MAVYDTQSPADIDRIYDHDRKANTYERVPYVLAPAVQYIVDHQADAKIAAQMKAYDFRKVIDNSVVERLVKEHFFEQLFGPGDQGGRGQQSQDWPNLSRRLSSRLDAMAEIVLGIGSSHGPLLSTPPEQWDLRAQADRENKKHWYRGKTYDYETLLRERAPGFAAEVTVESRRERFAQCHRAMEVLTQKFKEAAPEAVVIVGNDQREFFDEGLTPAITVYRGAQIKNLQHLPKDNPPGINIAEPGNSPLEGATYPGAYGAGRSYSGFARRRELRSRAIGYDTQSRAARGHSARLRFSLSFDSG